MHATTEQLLSLRDGEPLDAAVHDHVENCGVCSRELARLARVRAELRQLPPIGPRQALWRAVALGSLPERPAHRYGPWLSAIAIAASFVLGLFLIDRLNMGPTGDPPAAQQTIASSMPADETPDGGISEVVPSVAPVTLADLQQRSQRLEVLRSAMPRRPQLVRASTARTIVDLEDRIALVDMRLNSAAALRLSESQRQALWRERVNLMQSLLQLEYAQLQSPSY
jgi:hypothetical protein